MRVYVCARALLYFLGVVSVNRCTKRKVQTTANVQTYSDENPACVNQTDIICNGYSTHVWWFVPVYYVFMHDDTDLS